MDTEIFGYKFTGYAIRKKDGDPIRTFN